MSLVNIVILCGVVILIGIIKDSYWRKYLILILSVFVLFYFQPSSSIRYLGFWLPFFTLAVTLVSWFIISSTENRIWQKIWKPVVVILGVLILISSGRYIDYLKVISSSQVPQISQILLAVLLLILATLVISKKPKSINSFWIIFLIGVFLIIKTPYLAKSLSYFLRRINDQSTELASSIDIAWLGYSYIAFRIIHTIRDHQIGKLPDADLVDYINYVIFFPTLIAGPIERFENYVRSIKTPFADKAEIFGVGGKRIIVGLFKKFFFADLLAIIALNSMNALQIRFSGWMWVCLYAFTFQIFFDFSGYTDIAIGIGHFLGMKLPENFASPYLKPNLTQFWNNWHMTLTQWFRSYFFNPLTRSLRSGERRLAVPTIIFMTQMSTMVLIGLWHGVTWNFVLWGAWHGLGLFIHNRWSSIFNTRIENWASTSIKKWIVKGSGIVLTFNFVAVGWVFFITTTPLMAWQVLLKLFG